MSDDDSDGGSDREDVIARAKQGDRAAFGELVRTYQRRVHATAIHIMGNHAEADDVAQDAFVRAFRGLKSFDGRAEMFTWLYRITINTALNHIRKRKRNTELARNVSRSVGTNQGAAVSVGTGTLGPREQLEVSERLRRVLEAVAELSPTLRVTLILATVEGLPYREIAEILEIPEGTVAWRINEARKQLKTRLESGETPDSEVSSGG